MTKNTQSLLNACRTHAFNEMAAMGAAAGQRNRARTQRSTKDKARDPKTMRRNWRQSQGRED